MRPDRGTPRLTRTLVFALVAVTLSALGHLSGGGGLPGPAMFVLVSPPILLLSLWLSARQRGVAELLAVQTVLQAGLHVVYHWAHAAAPAPFPGHAALHGRLPPGHGHLPPGPGASPGHPAYDPGTHSLLPVPATPSTLEHAGHAPATADVFAGLMPSPSMLAGHLVAVAVTAWVMAKGEQALWRVAHRLRVRLWPAPPVVVSPAGCPAPMDVDRRHLVSRWAGRVVATRGPPAFTTA